MITFAITAVITLVCLFFIVVLLSLMVWVVTKMLRALFPNKFNPVSTRMEDEV